MLLNKKNSLNTEAFVYDFNVIRFHPYVDIINKKEQNKYMV